MADNAPVPEGGSKPPALPVAPPLKTGTADKGVAPLSSGAEAAPGRAQEITLAVPPPLPAKTTPSEGKLPQPDGNSKFRLPPKALKPRGALPSNAPVRTSPDAQERTTPAPVDNPPPWVVLPPVAAVASTTPVLRPAEILFEHRPAARDKAPIRPPPLPKSAEKTVGTALQVAPPLSGSEPAAPKEKLPPPQLPASLPSPHATTTTPPRPPALKPLEATPIVIGGKTDATVASALTGAPPLKPPFAAPSATMPKTEESKPALRPPVLPNKTLLNLKMAETAAAEANPEKTTPTVEKASPSVTAASEVAPAIKSAVVEKRHAPVEVPSKVAEKPAVLPTAKAPLPLTRAERAKKRRFREMIVFYFLLLIIGGLLYEGTLRFSRETRVEGQVIPPAGMPLADEVWIVSDFRQLTSGIAEDLAQERAPLLQEMQERQDHVQRVQADIAVREERIRLLQAQIQAAKDEESSVVKKAHDDAQQLWDGPGAQLDDEYNARSNALKSAIEGRAKSLNLKYAPDPTYDAPEVWANAYRLALYEVPAGVDAAKEYDWLNAQMKAWRDFVKAQDDQREQLREQAAAIKLSPAAKLTDLNAKIDDLQHRIDNTEAEEQPLKPELQQAQSDLADVQTTESGLDAKYYKQLSALPSASITKRIPMDPYGRFTWANLENDSPFAEGEKEHHYWLFARATRADGREYWALGRFSIAKDHTVGLLIDPDSFMSTKAMLRPELSPDEQEQ